jgi:hypothetical protein
MAYSFVCRIAELQGELKTLCANENLWGKYEVKLQLLRIRPKQTVNFLFWGQVYGNGKQK